MFGNENDEPLEQWIDKRSHRAATKNDEESEEDKDDNDRDEPELLVVHEEAPEFFNQFLGLVVGDVVNRFYFFFLPHVLSNKSKLKI